MRSSIIYFTLALLSKESAIGFFIVIPLSEFMFRSLEFKKAILKSMALAPPIVFFLLIRILVLKSTVADTAIPILDNVLNGALGFGQATATRAEILFYYIKLLFIPWPLSWDYSFNQIPIMNWNNSLPWLSLLIFSSLIIIAIFYFPDCC